MNKNVTRSSDGDVRTIFDFVESFGKELPLLTSILGLGSSIVDPELLRLADGSLVGAVEEDVEFGAVLVRGAGDTGGPCRISTDLGEDEVAGRKTLRIFLHFVKNFRENRRETRKELSRKFNFSFNNKSSNARSATTTKVTKYTKFGILKL